MSSGRLSSLFFCLRATFWKLGLVLNMFHRCFKICFTCVSKYVSPVFQILDRDRLDPFSDRVVRSCRMVGQQVFCRRTFTLKRLHTKAFFPNSLSFEIRDLLISLVCLFIPIFGRQSRVDFTFSLTTNSGIYPSSVLCLSGFLSSSIRRGREKGRTGNKKRGRLMATNNGRGRNSLRMY